MLGLVGTVYGMILSFMELSQPGHTPNPQRLADGISHAAGDYAAGRGFGGAGHILPCGVFRNRLIRLSMDTSNVADDLLTRRCITTRASKPRPA